MLGVIPADTASEPAPPRTPLEMICDAPEAATPTDAYVIVLLPAVHAPNVMAAALLPFAPEMVHPAPLRATATRA